MLQKNTDREAVRCGDESQARCRQPIVMVVLLCVICQEVQPEHRHKTPSPNNMLNPTAYLHSCTRLRRWV